MYKKFFYSFFLFVACATQKNLTTTSLPNWVDFDSRNKLYPNEFYLKGYTMSTKLEWEKLDDFMERLVDVSKKELIENVQVEVKNESVLNINENISYGISNIKSNYETRSQSRSNIQLANIVIEKTYNERTKIAYVFAYLKRSEAIEFYKNILNNTVLKIENEIVNAEQFLNQNDYQNALKSYAKAFADFLETNNPSNILNALKANNENQNFKIKIQNLIQNVQFKIQEIIRQQHIVLKTNNSNIVGSAGEELNNKDLINTSFSNNLKMPATNIPINLMLNENKICAEKTNEEGLFSCVTKKIKSAQAGQIIYAKINTAAYLNIDTSLAQQTIFENLSNTLQWNLLLNKRKIFVDYADNKQENAEQENEIRTKIKAVFSKYNYDIVSNKNEAQYVAIIKNNGTNTIRNSDVTFQLLNIAIQITEKQTEIFQNIYEAKGAGLDEAFAKQAATKKITIIIETDLVKWLSK